MQKGCPITSGLGIGGIGSDDYNIHVELAHAGHAPERQRRGPMPHGQLWEPCPRCDAEPVCLDCGLCERHCRC